MPKDTPKFIVFRDLAEGGFRWRLRSSMRETLAVSESGYAEGINPAPTQLCAREGAKYLTHEKDRDPVGPWPVLLGGAC